ncbi:hypothetical protein [Thermococcus sp.]
MSGRGHSYVKMILKNILLFLIVFLILASLVTLGQMRVKKKDAEYLDASILIYIKTNPQLQEQAKEMGMNDSQYAWYLAYKALNIKPTFWESFKYYFRGAIDIFKAKQSNRYWGATSISKTRSSY